jgi:putative DNA methylase
MGAYLMAAQTAFRKKLIEVSIPLETINKESAREKAPRAGHPSTMHLWWARRPLAACRAVLFAQLVDDPSACVEEFPTKAEQDAERDRLHKIIEAIMPWEAMQKAELLNAARYEIARSVARARGDTLPPIGQISPRQIIDYLQENAPPVYDPFSGGGSIPLEAQRLGLKAIGSDLNPVAVLIGKALIEFPPEFAGRKPINPEINELRQWKGAQGLAEDVRFYGRWMREKAQKKIGHLYPKARLKNGKDVTVIAWLWARTVPSPDPRAKGAYVPLASSFVLSAKPGKEVIVKPVVDRAKMTWAFEIEDKPSKDDIEAAKKGTKAARGANFACLLTGAAIDDTHIKSSGQSGKMSASLMAIVAEGDRKRIYLAPNSEHANAANSAAPPEVPEIEQPVPERLTGGTCFGYGLDRFDKLFTPRQLVALTTLSDLVMRTRENVLADAKKHWSGAHRDDTRRLADGGLGPVAYADAVATYLALCVSRQANRSATLTFWDTGGEKVQQVFARQALPMVWDFCECNIFSTSSGNFAGQTEYLVNVIENLAATCFGRIENRNAALHSFDRELIFATDPPYYDNIGYADLSDFFYIWLRRSLASETDKVWPDLFRRVVTPKAEELVANPHRHNGAGAAEMFFMDGIKKVLRGMADATANFPITLFYAFKQADKGEDGITSAGWSTFLQGVHDCGLVIDGTWPMRTELAGNLKKKVNALASSIMLVCRRRDKSALTITRADFLRALRREMPAALAEIRHAGVGPTDIQQAAIGPGMGVFTRHAKVLNTDGTPMQVRDALKLINQVREEITAPATGEYDPETLFALDWFAAKGFEKGRSGDAIVMTNAVNLSLDGMNSAGFFLADGGVARLLKREELPDDWDPKDRPPTVWEACQHLIKRLRAENGGIVAAATLYNSLGSRAEPAHALARRLYDICEQNRWPAEGYVYNQLHQEWDAIEKRAAALAESGKPRDLFSR